MESTLKPEPVAGRFIRTRLALGIVLAVLFLSGLGIRLYDLRDLPLDFHPTRQLFTAIIARSLYYQNLPDAPEWQQERAAAQLAAEETEPPTIDGLAALTYRLIGKEDIFFPRLYSVLFWLLGGIAVYKIAKELTSVDGAVVSLGVYLLNPYGVIASRSFQPDPLMVCLILFSWWCMLRWFRTNSWRWAIAAGLLAAAAMWVKSLAAFSLLGGMAGVFFARDLRKSIRNIRFWVMGIIAAAPIAGWTIYGFFGKGTLGSQFALRFFPNLWTDPVFYIRLEGMMERVIGLLLLVLALAAFFLLKNREERVFVAGLWGGYLLFAMVFAYYFITHDYYHITLVPIAAIAVAPLAQAFFERFMTLKPAKIAQVGLVLVIVAGMAFNLYNIRQVFHKADYSGQDAYWAQIGELLDHDARTVALTQDYGYRLAYWGWTTPIYWPYTGDLALRQLAGYNLQDFQERFAEFTAGNDYFLVTDLEEYDLQPQLKETLTSGYPVLYEGDGYIIYDLRNPLITP